jgi:hypothetical protein
MEEEARNEGGEWKEGGRSGRMRREKAKVTGNQPTNKKKLWGITALGLEFVVAK